MNLVKPIIAGVVLWSAVFGSSARAGDILTGTVAGGEYRVPVTSYRDLPFRAVIRQQFDFSCGSAALATLLRYHYGLDVDETQIFKSMYDAGDKAKIQKVGFSMLDMKQYLEARGYKADGYKVTLADLARVKIPAIVVITIGPYRHFVVVKGDLNGYVLIGDPAAGLKMYTEQEFMRVWDGVVFVIHAGAPPADRFNRAREWAMINHPPLEWAAHNQQSVSEFTRELPPMYQITPQFVLSPNASGG